MNSQKKGLQSTDIILAIALLGSLWGLSEVLIDEGIRAAGIPMRAGILTGFGMLAMGIVFGLTRRPLVIIAMPVVAILMKQLTVPILGVSAMCGANSCLAVALQGFALAGVGTLFLRNRSGNLPGRAAVGAGAAMVSAVPFYFAGLKLAPCNYLLSFAGAGGFMSFMITEGLAWAAFAAVFFPMGALLGDRLLGRVVSIRVSQPVPFYGAIVGLTTVCWIAASFAIFAGV